MVIEMTICPICKGTLELNKLIAPALDVYRGKMFAYSECAKCGVLVLHNPPNKAEEVDYSESGYYQRKKVKWSGLFDKIIALYTAHRISITRHALGDISLYGKRILDIGCGKGRFLANAQQLGAVVSGIEPTLRSYEEAASRLQASVLHASMSKEMFAAESFDVVTMWHVFEHIPDPMSMLEDCHYALKQGGKLILAVPNYNGIIAKIGGAVWFNLDPPRHLVHYDAPSLTSLVNKTGFEAMKLIYVYPELTYLSALQTLLNKLPITNNFLFNYLKRNHDGLPDSSVIYVKDLFITAFCGLLFAPPLFFAVTTLSLFKQSDCITLIARKR